MKYLSTRMNERRHFDLLYKSSSPIHGAGCFAKRTLRQGQLIISWWPENVMSEWKRKKINELSGVRIIGSVFIVSSPDDIDNPDEYINHSDTPNVANILGFLFATKTIVADEELLMDYRLLIASWEPASWYQFSTDRKGARPNKHLATYKGFMYADGYAGFNDLYRKGDIHEVACMAHNSHI